jgi:hypothetical protein
VNGVIYPNAEEEATRLIKTPKVLRRCVKAMDESPLRD